MVYSFATCPKSITRFKTHARFLRVLLLIHAYTFHISIYSGAHLGLIAKLQTPCNSFFLMGFEVTDGRLYKESLQQFVM